jgi:hypothetical protein
VSAAIGTSAETVAIQWTVVRSLNAAAYTARRHPQ